jgi:TRAP-type C4-dicarboxylate transport system permease small subunit
MAYATFRKYVYAVSKLLDSVACTALFSMMMLTCCDVFMRYVFADPIIGVYDIVSLLSVITIAFALPYSMLNKIHVAVEILIMYLSKKTQLVINVFTHVLGVVFFLVLSWQCIVLSDQVKGAGEVTPTLLLPFYPLIYCASVCFLLLCIAILVNLADVFITRGNK